MVKEDVVVTVLSTCMVIPSIAHQLPCMFLPAPDAWWRNVHYNRRLLFYKPVDDFRSSVGLLMSSLKKVLVDFYPWIGRLALSPVDQRLQIDFEGVDQGVEFVEAYTDDVAYSELREDGFQLKPFFDKLCKWKNHDHSEIFNIPLLSIQVTKLKDGGMVLGYAHSHVVADGHSMWHFMNSWSECARGSSISMPPLHGREALRLDNPCEDLAISAFEGLQNNYEKEDTVTSTPIEGEPSMTQRLFCFTTEMIQRLKEKASSERGGEGVLFTSYQVLAAHFWRCVTRARCLESSCFVHFLVLANCRGRLNPPLCSSYFGNCVSCKSVQVTAGQLAEDTLAETVTRIREVSRSCATHNHLWGLIHWVELMFKNPSQYPIQSSNSVPMMIASSPHFPCYDVDFGFSGRPEAIRTAFINGDGEMVIFPGSQNKDGSIDICMSLPPSIMDRLLKDPHFLTISPHSSVCKVLTRQPRQ